MWIEKWRPVFMAEGEAGAGAPAGGETPPPAPAPAAGSAAAAQAQVAKESVPPKLLSEAEAKPPEPPAAEPPKPAEEPKAPEAPKPLIDAKALKVPEGFSLPQEQIDNLAAILGDEKMQHQDRAQALLDLHTKALQTATDGVTKFWTETQKKWAEDVAMDKDIGTGDKNSPLKPEVKTAVAKLIDAHGGVELRRALDMTGAGNHPAVVKAFAKFAAQLTEGSLRSGSPPGAKPRSGAQAMYPDLPSQG